LGYENTRTLEHPNTQAQQYKQLKTIRVFIFCLGLLAILGACGDVKKPSGKAKKPQSAPAKPVVSIPAFSADSAYAYIEKQLAFGPRVPNTRGHDACGAWLIQQFESFGAQVQVQKAMVDGWDLEGNRIKLPVQNIIASFSPENKRRIMLSAHWDTRPYGDNGPDARKYEPIPGANDGGSGVAVLLELARQFGQKPPEVGVDIFLWDTEDYGTSKVEDSYCLGSQYWGENPHKPGYRAMYGINLDMVGAASPTFRQDFYSRQYGKAVVDKVWDTAAELGYASYFPVIEGASFVDDHYYVNLLAQIPCIDICDQPGQGGMTFFGQWHTHQDDIHIISKETLKAVGQTLMTVVYRE
jgi:Zn-dependent M28 family amino/carboxypeptidase